MGMTLGSLGTPAAFLTITDTAAEGVATTLALFGLGNGRQGQQAVPHRFLFIIAESQASQLFL
jgi:hypothetical protein